MFSQQHKNQASYHTMQIKNHTWHGIVPNYTCFLIIITTAFQLFDHNALKYRAHTSNLIIIPRSTGHTHLTFDFQLRPIILNCRNKLTPKLNYSYLEHE